jgi:hypothetical protein
MLQRNAVFPKNDLVPELSDSFERRTRDGRLGRVAGEGSKLATHLNCPLVEGKPNFYGVMLLSPKDLLRQDQSDQYVSPEDRPVDFEGHNKSRHEGARLMLESILDALNVVIDDDGYLVSFGPVRKLSMSLGLGYGRDFNAVGPPFQVTFLCILMNGGFCHDARGQG